MKLERLALKGVFDVFPGVVDLPLRDLPAGLIALTGGNGEGKTGLLELTPGILWRQLPARENDDPILYAKGRDSYMVQEFTIDGVGTFRARLSLNGPQRSTNALLEQQQQPNGEWLALNNGQRSTYDAVIKAKFPSFDLFINSSFAAQGRGDEFARRKPSDRKVLFAEFLALQHYAAKARAASEAAELAADARMRLTAVIEQLQRETAPGILDALDVQANELQVKGGTATARQRELQTTIADLETRLALLADQVAANAAAASRVQQLDRELTQRRADRASLDVQRQTVADALTVELQRITAKRDADVKDATAKIDGNTQIRDMADQIRQAIAAIAAAEAQLVDLRPALEQLQTAQHANQADRRTVERELAALAPLEQQLTRATSDAHLLDTVPCGGAGEYAACQFLLNATAAQAKIADLEARVLPKAQLADRIAALTRTVDDQAAAIAAAQTRIRALEAEKASHAAVAKYEQPLAAAEARIAELTTVREKAAQDAEQLLAEAQARAEARVVDLTAQGVTVAARCDELTDALARAQADLEATAAGNSQATQLQAELTAARREWDTVVAAVATAESGRQELERRRQELTTKAAKLTELDARRRRVEAELLEWRDLAKALGNGGLPDLEIDQAGPTISAITNEILLECFGPRFSVELVTQVLKADGSGHKDLFTVQVIDNEAGGAWRDIHMLSGGQKVIVQEALMCAISLFVKQRADLPIQTLWRDETGAALDPEHAIRYVAMLRKVAALGGYHRVFFISHNPEASALADAQIQIGGGQATIVLPPFQAAA